MKICVNKDLRFKFNQHFKLNISMLFGAGESWNVTL